MHELLESNNLVTSSSVSPAPNMVHRPSEKRRKEKKRKRNRRERYRKEREGKGEKREREERGAGEGEARGGEQRAGKGICFTKLTGFMNAWFQPPPATNRFLQCSPYLSRIPTTFLLH